MNPKLKEKITESVSAVLPITMIVLCISILLVPMDLGSVSLFLTGACLLVVGMALFQLGAEMAMTPLGEGIGVQISKTKKNHNSFFSAQFKATLRISPKSSTRQV